MIFLLLTIATMGQSPPSSDWVNQFVNRFESFDNIHVEGISSGALNDFVTLETEFKFFKSHNKSKYIHFPLNIDSEEKLAHANWYEVYSNPNGHFRVQMDFKTKQISLTDGHLLDSNSKNQYKILEVNNDLVGLSGGFAYSSFQYELNPYYTLRELFDISKISVTDERLNQKDTSKIVAQSSWGTITFWVDKKSLKPWKVVSHCTGSCKMPNGLVLSAVEADREYKTVSMTTEFDYSYDDSFSKMYPKKVTIKNKNIGFYNNEEVIGTGINVITYKIIEPWTKDDPSIFRISSTAKNGTPFGLSSHPQIAYHLEEGQLVLSANHKFLNKISQTVFGAPGFWQRLTLILVPLILSTALGLFLWKRWRPQAT